MKGQGEMYYNRKKQVWIRYESIRVTYNYIVYYYI